MGRIKRKFHNLIKIHNINKAKEFYFKRRYSLFGIKFTIKNTKKLKTYKKLLLDKKEKDSLKKYEYRKKELEALRVFREDKKYKLTCYIVTYNQSATISKCIDSILEQKTNYKYLIKILDDCSSDDTFDICLEYAKKYPDKIELNTVAHNSVGKMLTVAYENIESDYFCRIDGDDYWCDENKIQKALDFLEKNLDYVTYAHDTCVHYINTDVKKSNIHDLEFNKNIDEPISMNNFFYIHVSSRIHRNVIDFKNKYKNIRKRDRILWYLLLDAGKVYFEDSLSAVYTIHNKALYSAQSLFMQKLSRILIIYKINKLFNYKYDDVLTVQVKPSDSSIIKYKRILGKILGWEVYIFKNKYITSRIETIKKCLKIYKNECKQVSKVDRYTGDFIKADLVDIEKARKEFI